MAEPHVDLSDDLTIIRIAYVPGTLDPARVFRAMAGLIDAFHRIDRHLAQTVSVTVEPLVVLERVEAGSIRAILRTILTQVPDDALQNLDLRPILGQYLVRGKHRLLEWADGKQRVPSLPEVKELQQELRRQAPQTMTDRLLPPAVVPTEDLLWDLEALSRAVAHLKGGDSAEFISRRDQTRIETRLVVTREDIESLLTQEMVTSENQMLLLVKKPDYLGNSMWEFRLGEKNIDAKMMDELWLERFRRSEIPLRPGDALRARVKTEIARGFEGEEVSVKYYVLRVSGVVHDANPHQGDMLG
ncbi:MAG TPA: hypothetical protein VNJ03_00550 [Vicinamibacterales bacterium]|nr:hypothetical protein [Vicinamibacterales bacterium]